MLLSGNFEKFKRQPGIVFVRRYPDWKLKKKKKGKRKKNQSIPRGRRTKKYICSSCFFPLYSFFSLPSLFFHICIYTPIYKFFFIFLFSRSPIKRKHRNVSVNVETHQQSIEREARKLKKNIIFAFVNRPHSRSMCFLCWTKIIINGISGVLIEACTGWPEFSRGGKQNNKKKRREREREREREEKKKEQK